MVFGLFLGRGFRGRARTLRERLVDVLARPESSVRLLLGFAALLCAASLVISLSRGATIAVSAALLVFGGCLIAKGLGRRRTVAAALFFYAFTVFVGWFGWQKVADRFSSLSANPDIIDSVRVGFFRDTLRMSADFPLLGAGIGSFARLYPGYRTVNGTFSLAHAHNDYLELLAGGGLVGLVLFGWFVGAVLLAVVRASRRRRDPPSLLPCVRIARGMRRLPRSRGERLQPRHRRKRAVFLLPARPCRFGRSRARTPGRGKNPAWRMAASRSGIAHLAAALALAAVVCHSADLTARTPGTSPMLKNCGTRACASRCPPSAGSSAWQHGFSRSTRRIRRPSRESPRWRANPVEALELTRRALRLLPVEPVSLMQLGTLLAARGEDGSARQSFAAAVAADPAAARNRERFGSWLISRGDREAGLAQMREALALEPSRASGIFGVLVLAGFDDERIAAIVPPNPSGTAAVRPLCADDRISSSRRRDLQQGSRHRTS